MKPALFFGPLLAFLLSTSNVWAIPAQVLLIRHGEKPAKGPNLSPAGQARASALVQLFENDPRFLAFGTPVAIYAAVPTPADPSKREVETVLPLANSLGLQINENFGRDDFSQAAQEIMTDPDYEGKMVLICWDHTVIPEFVAALGVSTPMPAWPPNVFDRVIEINYNPNGQVTSFYNLPQRLMPGDSPQ
jgi:hypothetical protein